MMRDRHHLYPDSWRAIASQCKERAGNRCEHCSIEQYTLLTSKRGIPYIVYLHAAHKHEDDTANPDAELLCLCPTCHARYDHTYRVRAQHIRIERLKHRQAAMTRLITCYLVIQVQHGLLSASGDT